MWQLHDYKCNEHLMYYTPLYIVLGLMLFNIHFAVLCYVTNICCWIKICKHTDTQTRCRKYANESVQTSLEVQMMLGQYLLNIMLSCVIAHCLDIHTMDVLCVIYLLWVYIEGTHIKIMKK